MKQLEKDILAIAINENQYDRISFLEPNDFNNYTGFQFRDCYKTIQELKGDARSIYLRLLKSPLESIFELQNQLTNAVVFCNLEKLAVYLVEIRFRKVFSVLLDDLVMHSDSDIEMSMIQEYQLEIVDADIFVLTDHFLEYLGHHSSDYTKTRMEAYLKWRDGRIETIKTKI